MSIRAVEDAPPPEPEGEEPLTKREAAGCLFDGCACAGCIADAAVAVVLFAGVVAVVTRLVLLARI